MPPISCLVLLMSFRDLAKTPTPFVRHGVVDPYNKFNISQNMSQIILFRYVAHRGVRHLKDGIGIKKRFPCAYRKKRWPLPKLKLNMMS